MASIRKEVAVAASADAVWDAVRDFQAVHERLVPGFVVASTAESERVRAITFAMGASAREELVSCDDARRRMAYTATGALQHHNGVVEVSPQGAGALITWTIDFLPDHAAPVIDALMDAGAAAMKAKFG